MIKALITGGAGYKGTLLTVALLKIDCHVTILDNFMYGYGPALHFAQNKSCSIIKKDIRNLEKADVEAFDYVFHLASVSGYPACEANPHSAQTINVMSTENLVSYLREDQVLVYASTTSLYGKSGQLQDETSIPTPVSLYGVTKYAAEQICFRRPNSIVLRFATLFGASLKMRHDLMLNDFVHKAAVERSIILFDHLSVRTFLHVQDAIHSYVMTLNKREEMAGEIFNVGSEAMNFSKLELAEKINEHMPVEIIITELADPDRRDFIIDFSMIKKLGFEPNITIDEGIEELVRLYSWFRPNAPYEII